MKVQVTYMGENNGPVKVARKTKALKDMSSEEITKTCFGLFR